ncbi:MarR family transcriptional regulator (plasmid) [Leisingera sp. S132]|uniref:MarR family winged helix-turn-helix transcriptional regulator n=1 Tax=Leisingera sp. S132 TaxID=2867016 RepID=UPI0021A96EDA|nr:MarR family transcriptional regulator [Leisingera sp. S132]UWQ81525.1 MarR family transcriptional regulator [Leisingera sp. S132]
MKRITHDRENMALVLALLRSAQQFHRAIGPAFRAAGLTASQWDVLETLSNKGPMTVNALLERALGTSGNLDVVIKNLIRSGLVKKSVSDTDRRSRVLSLTTEGRAKVETFLPAHNAALAEIFEGLPADGKRQTIRMLNRLRRSMRHTRKDHTDE